MKKLTEDKIRIELVKRLFKSEAITFEEALELMQIETVIEYKNTFQPYTGKRDFIPEDIQYDAPSTTVDCQKYNFISAKKLFGR